MKPLLVIANIPSPNTLQLRTAVAVGAASAEIEPIVLTPFEAQPEHILQAGALILGTTENFGYMSGAVKDFFERIYYPCLESTQGLPIALYVKAGNDGTGALTSMERIILGLRWRQVQAPLIMKGEVKTEFFEACTELGAGMAEGLKLGIF
ncbi:flavodoxin family protein [uncultured Thiothrix sp.]|uniref:flavodoxin family protein n=1 Tax=uncultured Thiothrix sp. TaxID=223185 RepID=UPI0026137355|nr:flavodoxin family protein [uncultured Thiothrix sp.]HMT92176.1 flavodoxin family protein [Thiolinea sp.]